MPVQPDLESPAPDGVIHNIGYRAYDGARLGRQSVTRALFAHSLRGAYGLGRSGKSKVMPIGLFVVMCIPAFILAIITAITAGSGLAGEPVTELPLPYTSYFVVMQAVLTIFLAAQAPASVSRDLRFKTVPLYFSRPLDRVDYVAAKFAALSAALFILTAAPLLVMYVGALLAKLSFGGQTADFAQALLGVALVSMVLAGIGLVIASLTPRRGFGVAAIITVLVLSYGTVNALQGFIGHNADNMDAAGWLGLLSPVTLVDGVQVWLFGVEVSGVAGPAGNLAGAVFLLACAAMIAGCSALLVRRYRKVAMS